MKKLFTIILFIILTKLNYAQYWHKIDSVFSPSGIGVSSFSSPFVIDINNDGFKDIFLGSSDNEVKFYKNISKGFLPPKFNYVQNFLSQIYASGYQFTNSYYPVLADIDNDFNIELIIGGYNGLLLYKNIGTFDNPNWVKIDSVFANVNQLIGTDAKPAFIDIDADGDVDLFVGIGESLFGGPTSGITMAFRNIGSANKPIFNLDNTLSSGLPDAGYNSYPSFADLDNDGDYDLLIGRDLASLLYYKNTGTAYSPIWTAANSVFAIVETSTYWKNPCLTDLDNDEDYDLIYGTADGNLYYYQNTGTASSPSFILKSDFFKIIKNNGNGATVSIADFDNDGDYDFISGSWTGKINYFKNTGSKYSPIFTPSTASFTGLSVSSYSAPVFVDLDIDGDLDIVCGALNGKLSYFVNNNNSFTTNTSLFANISVSGFSYPAFGDLDFDGDYDLLLGAETSGATTFYINNNGTFSSNSIFVQGISFPANTRPVFSDIDNDGDLDCIFGKSNGEIVMYENIGDNREPVWVLNQQIFNGIKVKQNAAPCFADFDNDNRKDLIVAEYDGNFTFYKNIFALTDVENIKTENISFSYGNYPNPFNPETNIVFTLQQPALVSIDIYNALGQLVTNLVNTNFMIGTNKVLFNSNKYNLSSGIYFYSIKINENSKTNIYNGKMVLTK